MTSRGISLRLLIGAMLALVLGSAPPAQASEPPVVRVRLETTAGAITLAIDVRHAPKTAANFLAYVDDERLDGTRFYRASRRDGQPGKGFIQGGIDTDARRRLEPVELEPTSRTGLRHVVGAVSMARYGSPNSGTCNFSLLTDPRPDMDARPGYQGYAVFGRVIAGMDVVTRILAMPTGAGGDGAFKGQLLVRPVTITRAVRLDGTAKPTGHVKVWKLLSGV